MKKTAIFIPSYKYRYDELFNYLNNISTYDIYLILSKDDDALSKYYEHSFNDNVHLIETDCKNIGQKRQFILDYAYDHGYDYSLMIEDDIRSYAYKITEESRRPSSDKFNKIKITLLELINRVVECIEEEDACFCSPVYEFCLGFSCSQPGLIYENKMLNCGQFNIMDVKKVKALNIKYDTRDYVHEDVDIVLQILQHGKKCISISDYAFVTHKSSKDRNNSSIADDNKIDFFRMNLYLKYRDGIVLKLNKDDLRIIIYFSKYFNTFDIPIKDDEYHRELYKLCLEGDNVKLKQLIKDHKAKKSKKI